MASQPLEVTLLIGKSKEPYKVPRETLAAESRYFANYCDKVFNGNHHTTIALPDVSNDASVVIIEWLSQREYTLPKMVDPEIFCGIYKAVVDNQMEFLKAAMLEQLGDRIMKEESFDDGDEFTVPDAFDLFYRIAKVSSISDWNILRKLIDKVLPSWTNVEGELIRLATSEESHNLATAVIFDSLQETMWSNACTECRWKFHREPTTKCRCCGDALGYTKRQGPP
ncbi:hypothetical protein AA313_de0201290 [Arthrobotrys entomopaga]|nr:hypothetical protein AA313_de0201290 [Arthrobotrys entomopaga]